jgi:hypothetical protein
MDQPTPEEITEIKEKLKSGEIQITTGYVPPPMSASDKERLSVALGIVFGWPKDPKQE